MSLKNDRFGESITGDHLVARENPPLKWRSGENH
jgi:hypothetical protein